MGYWLENRLVRSQSLLYRSYVNAFTAGLSIKLRGMATQGIGGSFLNFGIFSSFTALMVKFV
jgi:hypothetical protein